MKQKSRVWFFKPLSALLAAVMVCGMAGCDKSEKPDSEVSSESSSEISQNSEPGEQSADRIKPEIVMDGQRITLPCKAKDIKGIAIDREYSFVVVPSSENVDEYSTAYFYYNNIRAGQILLEGDCSDMSDLGDATVIGIELDDDRISMSYMGLTYNSDRDVIISALGNPDRGGNIAMHYDLGANGSLLIRLDSKDTISGVAIYLYIR